MNLNIMHNNILHHHTCCALTVACTKRNRVKPRMAKSQDSACSRARSAALVLQRESSTLARATSAAEQCGCRGEGGRVRGREGGKVRGREGRRAGMEGGRKS